MDRSEMGNTGEFKKYYLDAKVNVDALPKIPANAAMTEVTGIYADAVTLFVAAQVGEMRADEAQYFKQKYSEIPRFFEKVPDEGFGDGSASRHDTQATQIASVWIRASAQVLLLRAEQKLASVK
jgi:hypothetical protein